MTIVEKTVLLTIAAAVAIGAFGSLLELAGTLLNIPALVKAGQKLEAISADIPKLLGKSAPAVLLFVLPLAALLLLALPACASQTERCLTAADEAHKVHVRRKCKGYDWLHCPSRPTLLEAYDKEQDKCRPASLQ